jgi:hypothetical protein
LAEKAAMTISETAKLLATIASYHPAFPVNESTVAAWAAAFREAEITSLPDAVRAVVRFYADPENTDPWIKPWHVIGGVRVIRSARLKQTSIEEVSSDLDPDAPNWGVVVQRRLEAVADGRVDEVRREITATRWVSQ